MELLEDLRGEAKQLGRALFAARHHRPALLLRWVVEGDIGRGATAQSTHSHNVRSSLKDRLRAGAMPPDRRPIDRERVVAIRHTTDRNDVRVSYSVGRQPTSDLFINDYTVSARHGRLHWVARVARWMFEDLGSTNGTWINGQRIPPQQRTLIQSTDEVQLGRLVFLFLEPDDLHRYLLDDY